MQSVVIYYSSNLQKLCFTPLKTVMFCFWIPSKVIFFHHRAQWHGHTHGHMWTWSKLRYWTLTHFHNILLISIVHSEETKMAAYNVLLTKGRLCEEQSQFLPTPFTFSVTKQPTLFFSKKCAWTFVFSHLYPIDLCHVFKCSDAGWMLNKPPAPTLIGRPALEGLLGTHQWRTTSLSICKTMLGFLNLQVHSQFTNSFRNMDWELLFGIFMLQ